jgi:DNA-binding transcriptional ArsR family regulator
MSARRPSSARAKAAVFAALGDETRLLLLTRLSSGQRYSIAELTEGSRLTRQAVTKHLRVLERVRMVHRTREGRESLISFDPQPLIEMKQYLELVSKQWDAALGRLKTFIESDPLNKESQRKTPSQPVPSGASR